MVFITLQETLQNVLTKIQENLQEIQNTFNSTNDTQDTFNSTNNTQLEFFDEFTPLLPPPPSSSQDQIQNHIQNQIQNQYVNPKTNFPKVLTNQLYLDIRQKDDLHNTSYLSFTNKTYTEHFKSHLSKSWKCTKSSFYFFIQAFYPDIFQHYASDNIIILSEEILDEYSNSINTPSR